MRLLLGLILLSSVASATPSMFTLLSESELLAPLAMMRQVEQSHEGVISAFEVDIENGELNYKLEVIDPIKYTLTAFQFSGLDGKLQHQKVVTLEADDLDELEAVKLLQHKKLSFSALVEMAMNQTQSHLLEAQLDHDLGIGYLELKLVDEAGKHKLAFDIENLRPLPLLKWD